MALSPFPYKFMNSCFLKIASAYTAMAARYIRQINLIRACPYFKESGEGESDRLNL